MPIPSLRSPPPNDPRPDPFAGAVIVRALEPSIAEIVAWCEGRVPMFDPATREDAIKFAVGISIKQGGGDAFRAGSILLNHFKWPVEMTLVKMVDTVISRLGFSLKVTVGEWVLRTGMRFPGKAGDLIEFYDENDCQIAGKVYGINAALGTATVIRESDERAVNVCIEQVVANITQKRFTPETPVLGRRYVDAPGLMEAANREDQARKRAERGQIVVSESTVDAAGPAVTITAVQPGEFPEGIA